MTNKLVIENLKHRPVRTALSAIAIGVEVTMMLTLVGISYGMLEDSARRAQGVGADIIVRPPGTSIITLSGAPLDERLVDKFFMKQSHVKLAVGSMVHPVKGFTTITGIELDQFDKLSGGFKYIEGGRFRNPDDILVDRYFARQNNLHPGDRIDLIGHSWRVAGVVEEGKLARIVLPLHVLQDLTSGVGKVSQIYVKLDDPKNIAAVLAEFKRKLPDYQIYSAEELVSLISINNVPGLKPFIGVIIGIAIVVGFLVVFLSMYTAVLERTREIGILKALGATPGFVIGVLLRETFLLAVIGSVAGILMTYGTCWLIMALVPGALSAKIVYSWWPIAGVVSLVGAVLGAAYPGWRAASQDPIEALSYE